MQENGKKGTEEGPYASHIQFPEKPGPLAHRVSFVCEEQFSCCADGPCDDDVVPLAVVHMALPGGHVVIIGDGVGVRGSPLEGSVQVDGCVGIRLRWSFTGDDGVGGDADVLRRGRGVARGNQRVRIQIGRVAWALLSECMMAQESSPVRFQVEVVFFLHQG